nr:transposon Ty3-I Gag-Pol polyprotein [Tanacetum cinerariifolium]
TTPFKSVYGRDPSPLNPNVQGKTQNAHLEEQFVARYDALQLLRSNLLKEQSCMKAQSDSKRRELSFEVGEFLEFNHFVKFKKLSLRYFRPYIVTRRVGLAAYELALPTYVSLLCWAHGQAVS